jgi:hypothetical protein
MTHSTQHHAKRLGLISTVGASLFYLSTGCTAEAAVTPTAPSTVCVPAVYADDLPLTGSGMTISEIVYKTCNYSGSPYTCSNYAVVNAPTNGWFGNGGVRCLKAICDIDVRGRIVD